MNKTEIVRLAFDNYKGRVKGNFSSDETLSVLRNAVIEANHGKTHLDPVDVAYGRCNEVFEIIAEIIEVVKHDILSTDPFFTRFVEYRNLALGDKNEFVIKGNEEFVVSEIAAGTQALRRQRLVGGQTYSVTTKLKGIKVYEEMDLLLAGRIDFNDLIDACEKAFRASVVNDIYTAWAGSIAGLSAPYAVTGTYTEADMLTLVQHVKAANGSNDAYILGTLLGLAKVVSSADSADIALESKYRNGYVGMFNGVPKLELMQAYVPGTTTFYYPDNVINVFAGDTKPIKYVTEGRSMVIPHTSFENVDLTQEYMMCERAGVAAFINGGAGTFGRYTITAGE